METPQELEVWYVIPALRREFSILMSKKGLKQREIAKKLEIAESAISHYLKSRRGRGIKFDKKTHEEIEKSVQRIIRGSNVMKEMQDLIMQIRKSGCLCKLHKKKVKGCGVCLT